MQENIFLLQSQILVGIEPPRTSHTYTLVIRLVFSGSDRDAFSRIYRPLYVQDKLLVFAVSRILCLASEPCRDLLKLLGLREPSLLSTIACRCAFGC